MSLGIILGAYVSNRARLGVSLKKREQRGSSTVQEYRDFEYFRIGAGDIEQLWSNSNTHANLANTYYMTFEEKTRFTAHVFFFKYFVNTRYTTTATTTTVFIVRTNTI